MKKTVLITGASAGIGRATAIYLAEHGYIVYGAARRVEKMADLTGYGIKPIALDVPVDKSVAACVEQILREAAALTSWWTMQASVPKVPLKMLPNKMQNIKWK